MSVLESGEWCCRYAQVVIQLPFGLHVVSVGTIVVHMATEEEQLEEALVTQVRVELAERGMQQKDLAAAMGIEPATLNRYLKSKRGVSMSVFYKMAAGLGMKPGELMRKVELRAEKNL